MTNLVDREFVTDDLDQVWLADITEHPTGEGKLYLCAIKDSCSTRIVGYSMSDRMTSAPRGHSVAQRRRVA